MQPPFHTQRAAALPSCLCCNVGVSRLVTGQQPSPDVNVGQAKAFHVRPKSHFQITAAGQAAGQMNVNYQ